MPVFKMVYKVLYVYDKHAVNDPYGQPKCWTPDTAEFFLHNNSL